MKITFTLIGGARILYSAVWLYIAIIFLMANEPTWQATQLAHRLVGLLFLGFGMGLLYWGRLELQNRTIQSKVFKLLAILINGLLLLAMIPTLISLRQTGWNWKPSILLNVVGVISGVLFLGVIIFLFVHDLFKIIKKTRPNIAQ